MDQRIVAAFSESARRTFMDMFGIEASVSAAKELVGNEEHGWDLTGMVGLAGHAQGVVAIRLTATLTSSLLEGTGVAADSDAEKRQLEGGLVGEVINIVAGQAASALRGLDIEIAPPVVVRGPNHKIGWPAIGPVMAIPFALPSGTFELDLCVKG